MLKQTLMPVLIPYGKRFYGPVVSLLREKLQKPLFGRLTI